MAIRVRVLYFGQSRDASGTGEEEFSLGDRASLRTLLEAASERHRKLGSLRKSWRVAINEDLARGSERLKDGDVVAVLPPVAGG